MVGMLEPLFAAKQQYLSYFFENLDMVNANKVFQALLACKGTIFCTGVGKSGFIAKKIAATIASTGNKALYMSPLDALHGDIGLVSENDLFFLFSKSGETEELLHLLPHLQAKKAFLIAITSNPQSRLTKACQLSVDLPLKKELCPFDLAPTTSTTIQMIFGDVLAVAMMQEKKLTIEEYALNHPAGRIGKRAAMRVKDLMHKNEELPIAHPSDKIINSLVELSKKQCGCLLIVEEDQFCGIFTDGDLRRVLEKFGAAALEMNLGDLMTRTPKCIGPDALLWDAVKIMEGKGYRQQITVLPVLSKENKLVGLIKLHDIIQAGL